MSKKVCPKCKKLKTLKAFRPNKYKRDGRQSYCRKCDKQLQKLSYKKHHARRLEETKKSNLRCRKELLDKLWAYLLEHSCVDCPENDPVVLEFDHIGEKTKTVSQLIKRRCSWETLLLEIEKCEVRCANCHKRKTAKTFKWWKFRPMTEPLNGTVCKTDVQG